jgi:DNA-binding transcriptional regulator YdaS (Cro superfamily)
VFIYIKVKQQFKQEGKIMKSYEQIKQEQASELMRLIKFAGSQSRLARALDVSPQVVQNWVKRGRISATCAIEAEEQTNGFITKEELRPDVDSWSTEQ